MVHTELDREGVLGMGRNIGEGGEGPVVRWVPLTEPLEDLFLEGGQWSILQGPCKFDLMVALFHGSTHAHSQPLVDFTIETEKSGRHLISAVIIRVGRIDGSGENWTIKGLVQMIRNQTCRRFELNGDYRTDRRSGWLTFSR